MDYTVYHSCKITFPHNATAGNKRQYSHFNGTSIKSDLQSCRDLPIYEFMEENQQLTQAQALKNCNVLVKFVQYA